MGSFVALMYRLKKVLQISCYIDSVLFEIYIGMVHGALHTDKPIQSFPFNEIQSAFMSILLFANISYFMF